MNCKINAYAQTINKIVSENIQLEIAKKQCSPAFAKTCGSMQNIL